MQPRVTPEQFLEELRTAQFVTQLPFGTNDQRFRNMLEDKNFAKDVQGELKYKIYPVDASLPPYRRRAHHQSQKGWLHMNEIVEASLDLKPSIITR